jgi:hypothetical protein
VTARLVVVALAVIAALFVDVGSFGLRVPTVRRQVDEGWRAGYRGWVWGFGYGIQLGAGVVTVVTTSTVYVTWLAAALSGSAVAGAVIGNDSSGSPGRSLCSRSPAFVGPTSCSVWTPCSSDGRLRPGEPPTGSAASLRASPPGGGAVVRLAGTAWPWRSTRGGKPACGGRTWRRPRFPGAAVRLANFPLPITKNTYAAEVADDLRPGHVLVSLVELDPALADRGLYAAQGAPTVGIDDLDPRATAGCWSRTARGAAVLLPPREGRSACT